MDEDDFRFMGQAIEQAKKAWAHGEVPVGAVVVCDGHIVGEGFNRVIADHDPTAHAEILALRSAGKTLSNYRLTHCTLYVTLQPCSMCEGAIDHARVKRVVFGAADTHRVWAQNARINPRNSRLGTDTPPTLQGTTGGVRESECAGLLSEFFSIRRQNQRDGRVILREDALRSNQSTRMDIGSDEWPVQGEYTTQLPNLAGLRLHYWMHLPTIALDAKKSSYKALLCIHGHGHWGWQFAPIFERNDSLTPIFIMDRPGHGWSDKTKHGGEHTLAFQLGVLRDFIADHQEVREWQLVACDGASELALLLCKEVDCIEKLTLLNPSLYGAFQPSNQGGADENSGRSWSHVNNLGALRKHLLRYFHNDHARTNLALLPFEDNGHIKGWARYVRENGLPSPQAPADFLTYPKKPEITILFQETHRESVEKFFGKVATDWPSQWQLCSSDRNIVAAFANGN